MKRCSEHLRKPKIVMEYPIKEFPIQDLSFSLAGQTSKENATWARFFAVLFPAQLTDAVNEFWGFMGDGISSRHAEFCLERFPFMHSMAQASPLRTSATSRDLGQVPQATWDHVEASTTNANLKAMIAKFVTPQNQSENPVNSHDVFLYPKGMCAIGTVARQLVPTSTHSSEAVIFG
jgi:cystathionine gamma-synthase